MPQLPPSPLTCAQASEILKARLVRHRGILNGRVLYQEFPESTAPAFKSAMQALVAEGAISVKGSLDHNDYRVFQVVLVSRH